MNDLRWLRCPHTKLLLGSALLLNYFNIHERILVGIESNVFVI